MEQLLIKLGNEVAKAFKEAGYDENLGKVTVSNRPDLCEYQCNGAMAGAKIYKKAPTMIANEVAEILKRSEVFSKTEVCPPGFINLNISDKYLCEYAGEMACSEKYGVDQPSEKKVFMVDYGGPNVAKPLHVGHLRSAVIGESIKRIIRYMGHEAIGDIHLGDWGLQMGLVIAAYKEAHPNLVFFDESYEGEYPQEAPFTVTDLEEIYPKASARSKEDAAFKDEAMLCTKKLQDGVKGYRAFWKLIMEVSIADLKKNYNNLNVEFDLWKGESDVYDLIPGMVDYLKEGGYAYISDGALVVDVKEETDTKEIPPCMILKSDGASLYNTTDLATIMERRKEYDPDCIIYLTDKRQDLYFEQVFRCAKKTGLCDSKTKLVHIGFGTVNGKDGKPFKTRDGGVMRLEYLVKDINEKMYEKIISGREMNEEEAKKVSETVALSAIKYGDLSNQASKDYIFDTERFMSFEGDTGPYLLYTVVRIKSILKKYSENGGDLKECSINGTISDETHKNLLMKIAGYNEMMNSVFEELAPHRICAYLYDLANVFNSFYHENKILTQEDEELKKNYIGVLKLTLGICEDCMQCLGFEAPDRM
ncbi:MAG: arginine--tRNA ligase [Lachnospiraceae bacterium]|nr:arginine--tRNA ligase [Lachnospiraceae bacterium]